MQFSVYFSTSAYLLSHSNWSCQCHVSHHSTPYSCDTVAVWTGHDNISRGQTYTLHILHIWQENEKWKTSCYKFQSMKTGGRTERETHSNIILDIWCYTQFHLLYTDIYISLYLFLSPNPWSLPDSLLEVYVWDVAFLLCRLNGSSRGGVDTRHLILNRLITHHLQIKTSNSWNWLWFHLLDIIFYQSI